MSLKSVQYLKQLKTNAGIREDAFKNGFMELGEKKVGVERCIGDRYRCDGSSHKGAGAE